MTKQQQAQAAGCVRKEGPLGTFTIECPMRDPFGVYIEGEEARAWDDAAYETQPVGAA